MILVDANVLLRLIQVGHPHQQPAIDAIAHLHTCDREQFVICAQTLFEMYAVCTRPTNGNAFIENLAPSWHRVLLEKLPNQVVGRDVLRRLADEADQGLLPGPGVPAALDDI